MKNILLIVTFLITVNISAAQGWFTQSGGTSNTITEIYFTDTNTGWLCGNGGLIKKTTNGGTNWSTQTSGTTEVLWALHFVNSSSGWCVGNNGIILYTSNGGTNWITQASGTFQPLWYTHFVNSTTGWASGSNGVILKTTNAGTSWSIQPTGVFNTLYSIFFADVLTGYAAGDGGIIMKPTNGVLGSITMGAANGGTNWLSQNSGTGILLHCANFVSSTTGWITGFNGLILKTTNGGTNWLSQSSGVNVFLRSCDFTNASYGWAAGDNGTIVNTTNGGSSWNIQTSDAASNFYSTCFINSYGWASGENGTIRATLSGGLNPKFLNANLLIEGFYNEFTDQGISDTVKIRLRNPNSPYGIYDSAKTHISASGSGQYRFNNMVSGNYFLDVSHRNSIETWSANAVSFAGDTTAYDFTVSSSQAFGNNLTLKGTRWTIYSGNPNQDDIIDAADLILINNDVINFESGYIVTDVNGDNFADASDVVICYNNSINFVGVVLP
ncbi:MAG: YCF48-related protein [bacterium]